MALIRILTVLSIIHLFGVTKVYAGYPGVCTAEVVKFKWHHECFPGNPRHKFPTEEKPMNTVICDFDLKLDSDGKYTEDRLTCERKTVTSGEYWGQCTSQSSYIKNYYYENGGWRLSDSAQLRPHCPPFDYNYCNGILVVWFSNEDKQLIDSYPHEVPEFCKDVNSGPAECPIQ